MKLEVLAIPGFPLVEAGMDLAKTIEEAMRRAGMALADGDIVVVAQKVVSKAEGRLVDLAAVKPGPQAEALAAATGKDPRMVQVILDESREVLRAEGGHLITRHRVGYISANACVDRSNVSPAGEWACLLPEDPLASAERLMGRLREAFGARVGVIISDSFGRPFRLGAVGVSLAAAGFKPVRDYRGQQDLFGYTLRTSVQAVADELASAASLLMGQGDEGRPVVVIRGVDVELVDERPEDATLVRPPEEDLFLRPAEPVTKAV